MKLAPKQSEKYLPTMKKLIGLSVMLAVTACSTSGPGPLLDMPPTEDFSMNSAQQAYENIPDPSVQSNTYEAPPASTVYSDDVYSGEATYGDGQQEGQYLGQYDGQYGNDVSELLTVFYFEYDQADLQPEAFASLKSHAQRLSQDASQQVRLEGHSDERGTREYNMALGERRAQAVAQFLKINGVGPSQINIVSYGEEKPVEYSQGDESWLKNRRVELIFQ